MARSGISRKLHKCDSCGARGVDLYLFEGIDVCDRCKGILGQAARNPQKGPPKVVQGCFEYNGGRRAR